MTVEQFAQMDTADNEAYELVDGELIPLTSQHSFRLFCPRPVGAFDLVLPRAESNRRGDLRTGLPHRGRQGPQAGPFNIHRRSLARAGFGTNSGAGRARYRY